MLIQGFCSGAGSVFALLRGHCFVVIVVIVEEWLFLVRGALHGLCSVPGLVRLLGLILVGGSSGKRRIFGNDRRLISPARVPEREGICRSSERIAARGDWIQLAHAGARPKQLEDHTRWKGPR